MHTVLSLFVYLYLKFVELKWLSLMAYVLILWGFKVRLVNYSFNYFGNLYVGLKMIDRY